MLIKIFVISFKDSISMSFVLKQDIKIVGIHSAWIIKFRFFSSSDNKLKHLQES